MITLIFTVLSHTPLWVWALLAALVALGLLQARDHVLTRARVLAQPLALGALSLYGVSGVFGLHTLPLGGWLAGLALGAALARPLHLPGRVQALPDGRFSVGGSWAPLGLLMLIFWLRYAVAVALAMVPALAGQRGFVLAASLLYGLASGLFGARAWRVLQHRPAPGRAAHVPA